MVDIRTSADSHPATATRRATTESNLETTIPFGPVKQIDAGLLNVGYVDVGPANGRAVVLLHGLSAMAELTRQARYDRMTDTLCALTGEAATSIRDFVKLHADAFEQRGPDAST